MNPDRDLTPVLRGWLAADERDLPEPVRAVVMATIAAVPQRHRRWLPSRATLTVRQHRLRGAASVGLLLALLALLAAALLLPLAGSSPPSPRVANGWIAFSSQPHGGQVMATDFRRGGDIYLAHDRDDLRILVSRGPDMDTNVCPAFSPDGTRLAYGQRTDAGTALVILDLAADGSIVDTSRLPLETTITDAPCPRWSADGTRIGSLEGESVVVRGLDGSILEANGGDPTLADFAGPGNSRPLDLPSGELSVQPVVKTFWESVRVRLQDGEIIVHPNDGSPDRTIALSAYAVVGWSPDSTKVLLMRDISGMDFELLAVSVAEPFTVEVIADAIRVNGGRSWPDRPDVAWQALFE